MCKKGYKQVSFTKVRETVSEFTKKEDNLIFFEQTGRDLEPQDPYRFCAPVNSFLFSVSCRREALRLMTKPRQRKKEKGLSRQKGDIEFFDVRFEMRRVV